MSDSKYSVLFMRDDTNVKRFRLSPFWIKFFLFMQVFLMIAAVVGIYGGLSYWWENRGLTTENRELVKKLEEAELKLGTLANMEKILEDYDNADLQTLLGPLPVDEEEGQGEGQESAVQEDAQDMDLTKLFGRTDKKKVRLGDVEANFTGSNLDLNFKLENTQGTSVLTGNVDIYLVMNSGELTLLEGAGNDLRFQIQRRKFYRTTFTLPQGVTDTDVFGLRFEIKRSDGEVIFSETYPLYRIMP